MKKPLSLLPLLFSFAFFIPIFTSGQGVNEQITTSKLTHTFSNLGFLKYSFHNVDFYNQSSNGQGYNLGYASGLMLGGNDENGNLHMSLNFLNNNNGYIPGILTEEGEPVAENETYFDRIWSVKSEEISLLKKRFDEDQLTFSDLSKDVAEWPAKGNPYFGYNIEQELAPFFDNDSDGIYDPLNGDLPIPIEENEDFIPSKFTFCVYYNNVFSISGQLDKHGIEIMQISYTLDCGENNLENSVFSRVVLKNKGTDLENFKFGLFKDFDLGCHEDDHVGTNQNTNSIYAYNEGIVDDSQCSGGVTSMPSDVSAIYSTAFLSHPIFSSMPSYIINNSVPKPFTTFGYNHLLNGRFSDGTPLTIGGDGYDPQSDQETNLVFPDLPNDPNGWHLNNISTFGIIIGGLVTSVDLGSMNYGESKIVDLVDVLLPFEYIGSDLYIDYENRINNLKDSYNDAIAQDSEFDCFSFAHCEDDCVWPGDVNGNGRVEANDVAYLATMYGDNVSTAKKRYRISTDWQAFTSESWLEEEAGIDYKYGDVNGNGEINQYDAQLLIENIKLKNNTYIKQPDVFPASDPKGISTEVFSNKEISTTGSLIGKISKVIITLGDEDLNITQPIFSLSFDVIVDTNLVFFSPWFFTEGNAFDGSEKYLDGNFDEDLETLELHMAADRYSFVKYQNDEPKEQGGTLIEVISVEANVSGRTKNPNGKEYAKIEIVNILAFDKDGNRIEIGNRIVDSVLVTDLLYDPELSVNDEDELIVKIFPNPVSNMLNVKLTDSDKGIVRVRDLQGRLIEEKSYNSKDFEISTDTWDKGIYFLNISEKNRAVTKKVIKI